MKASVNEGLLDRKKMCFFKCQNFTETNHNSAPSSLIVEDNLIYCFAAIP
jgi:hypothetical protein